MIEAVVRSKGLRSLAKELGFRNISNVVVLGTDSSAAKSFVCRRGLGKMRHLEIRDLWLQKEVREGKLRVVKVKGSENPADLMTKILNIGEIEERLRRMNLVMERQYEDANKVSMGWMNDSDGVCRDDDDGSGPCLYAVFQQEVISETAGMSDQAREDIDSGSPADLRTMKDGVLLGVAKSSGRGFEASIRGRLKNTVV